ncbi:MAG: hypothetical protein NTW14_14125 [bacterium]|nr:hypothetical protein [bacterium]
MFDDDPRTRREIRQLKKMIRKSPLLYARLAECYLRLGDQKHAEKLLLKGVEEYPDYVTGFQVLAESLMYRCLYTAAEEYVQMALAKNPTHLGLLALLTKLKELNEEESALNELEQNLAIRDPFRQQEVTLLEAAPEPEREKPLQEESAAQSLFSLNLDPELRDQPDYQRGNQNKIDPVPEPETPSVDDILELRRILQDGVGESIPEDPIDDVEIEPEPQAASEKKVRPRKKLATKTLGELYATQQKYDEAIEIYENLMETDPENRSYRKRLSELKGRRDLAVGMPMEAKDE